MDELDQFIIEIIEEKNLPGLTEEVKSQLIDDLKAQLLDRVDHALLEELSDEQLDEFTEQVSQSEDEHAAEQYLTSHGVDIQKISARVMLAFRDLYLQNPRGRQEN